VGHVIRMGEIKNVYRMLSENLKGRDHPGNLGIDGRTILERILGKQDGKVQTGFIWLRTGTSGGFL